MYFHGIWKNKHNAVPKDSPSFTPVLQVIFLSLVVVFHPSHRSVNLFSLHLQCIVNMLR